MPKLGATMEGATILQWYKAEGEPVQKGEPIVEIQTDKVNIDVEADAAGIVLKRLYETDIEIAVDTVIAYIGQEGEAVEDRARTAKTAATASEGVAAAVVVPMNEAHTAPDLPVDLSTTADRPRATPSARRVARLHNVDLRLLQGSGPLKRIQKIDVEQYVASRQKVNEGSTSSMPVNEAATSVATGSLHEIASAAPQILREGNRIPVAGIRKVVGQRMASSAFSAPHVTLTSEVNLAETVALRNRLLPVIEAQSGYRLSYTEIVIMAVAKALRRNPTLNASHRGDYIELYEEIHIGMAVAVPGGLVVPVVRNADQKGLIQIVETCKVLAKAARENNLKLDQLSGSTLTVSNLGMYRVEAFTPIINLGEAAILGVGRMVEKPVVVGGAVEVRPMMTLSLSFDHRVTDGAPAAQFLTDLCNTLEQPDQLLL